MKREPWTKKEDERLSELLGTMTSADIGNILGRSDTAVRKRASILKLSAKSPDTLEKIWTEQEVQTLLYLRSCGVKGPDIARRLGKDLDAVYGKIGHLNKNIVKERAMPDEETLWGKVSLMGLRVPLNRIASVLG